MTYGVEAYAPKNHALKADGTYPEMDDVLAFKVIEFNKESKKILVSHTKTYNDEVEVEKKKAPAKAVTKKAAKEPAAPVIAQEKTTLGDLDVLSSLKESMEKKEGKK